MSIDINWEAATSGPDGEALEERIRSFIHDKFQQIALPRFIRSVEVNSFDFGTVGPELQIKDLCDPFADFYEEDEDGEWSESSDDSSPENGKDIPRRNTGDNGTGGDINSWRSDDDTSYLGNRMHAGFHSDIPIPSTEQPEEFPALRSPINFGESLNPSFFPRSGTPGIPGGTSNVGYYYMPRGGLSGTQTPLSPAARGPFLDGRGDARLVREIPNTLAIDGTIPAATAAGNHQPEVAEFDSAQSRPSTSDTVHLSDPGITNRTIEQSDPSVTSIYPHPFESPPRRIRERKPEDFQVLCRLQYAGNMRLSLTAQILLDYPMPNFVGLPLKLNITGFTFDGVAVLAYIRKRVHLCFLSPEDADTLLGAEVNQGAGEGSSAHSRRPNTGGMGPSGSSRRIHDSLLRDIRVESEIGRKENGKQVLKNVGKVEKFVLEQVRRIFEEEFVYPSFWTFLV